MRQQDGRFFVKKELYTCFLGIFFSFCAIRGILDLQTSINIEDGLGSTCGFVMCGVTILCSISVVPSILKHWGPKSSLIAAEITYLLFVLSNCYPVYATMIPASMFTGLGEALVFPALSMYNVYYAREYAVVSKRNQVGLHLHRFVGICYGVQYITRVFGNMITFVVLSSEFNESDASNFSVFNESINISGSESLRFCGANDCQNPNLTSENLTKYVASKTTTYVLLGVFSGLLIIAMLIHLLGIEAIKSTSEVTNDMNENSAQLFTVNPEIQDFSSSNVNEEAKELYHEENTGRQTSKGRFLARLLKNLHHFVNRKQLLLAPIQLYSGAQLIFVTAEISRAYFSCAMGVRQVGLGMAVFGFFGAFSAAFNGILSSHFGRNISLLTSFLLDLITYVLCLLWQPDSVTSWLAFLLVAILGYSSGIWQSVTNAMCADYFKDNQEIAFAAWTIFFSLGMAIQYGWSTYLCVRSKIYALLAILCISGSLYGFAEYNYKLKGKRQTKHNGVNM